MDFYAVLEHIRDLLQRRGRVTYRALKVQFQLDDEHLEALKEELIEAERQAVDEQGKVLVWVGAPAAAPAPAVPPPQTRNSRPCRTRRRTWPKDLRLPVPFLLANANR